ncbi:MAG TPA: SCP2 sterol-binding domain-containing protein [Actinomycetota bacterium]|jgi:putative sterol carrier protein|nr:SCP2 sterol-binding domain-containing protein [Actinomycetota bacterium]
MYEFPREDWFGALADAINASEAYRAAASDWEGDIAFLIEADPERGVPTDVWGYLDLWHGACRSARLTSPEAGADAEFAISAAYRRWKDVVRGELDPVRAMMQGKLRVRGDLPKILRYVQAAQELVVICGTVPTTFPDEA